MNPPANSVAFGAPEIEPRWTSSAKEGMGTAHHTSCRPWFTLSHGIVNEIYYPQVDQLSSNGEFTIAIACGGSYQSTAAKLLLSLAGPFELHRLAYAGWLAAHVEEWTVTTQG